MNLGDGEQARYAIKGRGLPPSLCEVIVNLTRQNGPYHPGRRYGPHISIPNKTAQKGTTANNTRRFSITLTP